MTTVVWFKRDLRTRDHAPLVAAAALGEPVIPLYVIEDDYWQQPDTSARQWHFIRDSLDDLDQQLRKTGSQLVVMRGSVDDALKQLKASHSVERVFCHQETGGQWTFERDQRVIGWCSEHQVEFREWNQFGVVRRLKDRDVWDKAWSQLMRQPVLSAPTVIPGIVTGQLPQQDTSAPDFALPDHCPDRQAGGSLRGEKLLASFLERRCVGYQYNISSPLTAVRACSRLSPHLAYGSVSLREVYQGAKAAGEHRNSLPRKKKSLTSFRSRLHWHCHFIQKLEDEPELEFRAMHRELEGLKTGPNHSERLQRWRQGQTGWPLVDACMRSLQHTGWLNFRMRAMLMAVASYQLWLHWRDPALHLARWFTDFEPGIHYSQTQMQSGLTGINALRIYNPVLQSQKLDPDGEFIRRWIPELAGVPTEMIHTPWLMTPAQKTRFGGNTYIAPVCDHEQAARAARKAVGDFRKQHVSQQETSRVLKQHGSRKGPVQKRPAGAKNARDDQLSLFD
ncbi:FAD-binding domain-containing protein [Marinobacter halophilus]|uniref:Deoxyribodipyrimidine photo-lyase n=1 Tax=Marinobacter halophilus TaxID=1323740 RepID=A0A2T1KEG2_9GAMM|nr:deoxyribodipyrimidine photo-lyase [Marinobacter halophilus]PSF08440.1 deoxyribodipyrimidine photo-lyase [Marinobacter halophilus]GGC60602.1 deoxyribodipyrimidine photo-lyase [Marinobacter halophilus]